MFHQLTFSDIVKDEVELDSNIIIIGNETTQHNLELFDDFITSFTSTNIFALDCETFGQESWQALWFKTSYIRLLQIGLPDEKVLVIDFGGWDEEEKWELIKNDEKVVQILEVLKQKLFDRKVLVLGVNLKFDMLAITHRLGEDFKIRQARDLMLISQVIWAGVGVEKAGSGENRSERCKMSHGLAAIAAREGIEVDKTEQTSNWGLPLRKNQINYAAKDVRVLFSLYSALHHLVESFGLTYPAWVECNLLSAFVEMEYYGLPISKEVCYQKIEELKQLQNKYYEIFTTHFPGVSPTSNVQVLKALQEIYPEIDSVRKEILGDLDHPAAKALVEARAISTDIAYIQSCLNNSFNGSVRSTYRQIAAGGGGRSSCAKSITVKKKKYEIGAQLQNPSKKIRDIFVAPEGWLFIDFDGAQMHARIAAEVAQVEILKKIFIDDFDGHSILAGKLALLAVPGWKNILSQNWAEQVIEDTKTLLSVVWNQNLVADIRNKAEYTLNYPEVVKTTANTFRDVAKTALYSILNGATASRLESAMHQKGFFWFTLEDGKRFLEDFFSLYPELRAYIRRKLAEANSSNFVFNHFLDVDNKPIEGSWGRIQTVTGRHLFLKKYPNKYKPGVLTITPTDGTAVLWAGPEKDIIGGWVVETLWQADAFPEWQLHVCNLPHDQATFLVREPFALDAAKLTINAFLTSATKVLKTIPALEEKSITQPELAVKKVLTK